jgi:hypothetical protein
LFAMDCTLEKVLAPIKHLFERVVRRSRAVSER